MKEKSRTHRLRIKMGATQDQVVERYKEIDSRFDKATLSRIENGIAEPPQALTALLLKMNAEEVEETPKPLVADLIPTGRGNAIRRENLRVLASMNDRELRRAIREDRKYWPILNLSSGEGYYIAENEQEALAFCRQEEARYKAIQETVEHIRRQFA